MRPCSTGAAANGFSRRCWVRIRRRAVVRPGGARRWQAGPVDGAVGMADRAGQRVRSIEAGQLVDRAGRCNHVLDYLLLRALPYLTTASLGSAARRIPTSGPRTRPRCRSPPRAPGQAGGLRIDIDEDDLDRLVGLVGGDDLTPSSSVLRRPGNAPSRVLMVPLATYAAGCKLVDHAEAGDAQPDRVRGAWRRRWRRKGPVDAWRILRRRPIVAPGRRPRLRDYHAREGRFLSVSPNTAPATSAVHRRVR